jgi:small-conductance mechanosensitive channel
MKRDIIFTILFGLLAAGFYALSSYGIPLGIISQKHGGYKHTYAVLLTIIFAILAAYQLIVVGIRAVVSVRRRVPGEVRMLTGLVRVGAGVAILIVILSSLGSLTAVGAVVAGFAGLLLGWSLQAPVSGIAAWAMITVKRPFRVGDRVLLPSLGLNGDVMDVGLMYTSLNQVGGTIGSEEAIGRHILIPNAMLFTQVVVNYTPEMGAEEAAYFLDEVIVRITFDSDWDVAEQMLLEAAREVTALIVRETGKEPYIRSDMYDYGVYMRLRYMTLATDRPRITHEITKRIFRGFQRDLRVDLAIPYVYSYRHTLPSQRFRYPSEDERLEEISIGDIDDAWLPGSLSEAEEETIRDLARHIDTVGLLQPVVAERQPDGRYRVVAGTKRLRACKLLGWRRVPATILGAKPPADLA